MSDIEDDLDSLLDEFGLGGEQPSTSSEPASLGTQEDPSLLLGPKAVFSKQGLGNGIQWDVCEPGIKAEVTISFIQATTFVGTLFGKSVI